MWGPTGGNFPMSNTNLSIIRASPRSIRLIVRIGLVKLNHEKVNNQYYMEFSIHREAPLRVWRRCVNVGGMGSLVSKSNKGLIKE